MSEDRQKGSGEESLRTGPKAPYISPRVTVTEISVEDVLMAICKGGGDLGPMGNCIASCSSSSS